ncbi:hypothetical protein [Salinimicrobium sp. TH3]|uniref:hypothetical protein n=1 Tax=Salinimicrobium sp. TH3 TaxID=2997342 RepID=UPI002276D4A3|nr:hypothetical protein [Salinimicrobium sp. TH3]MCY2686021.1 hypothetical protein [Salinimicrobium sp. TH3]
MTPEQLQKAKKARNILIAAAVFAFVCYGFAMIFIPWGWAIYSLLLLSGIVIVYNLIKIQKRIKEIEDNPDL